ncbi:MAG TPA: hypothetical protein VJY62_18830 [Bacteroidia bacterium]|nr:hypothetical protein [Bacteroidia bacterium]
MTEEKKLFKTFLWLALFSIAMGYMESAIVVYLRKIYYPEGFRFPLTPIEVNIGVTEILREAATLIMLLTIGIVAGKTKLQRFSFFIFCFGIWDIFYYVFLKMLLDWPAHLFDWDILFLIPVPWVGPVIAPCILSLTMIAFAITFTSFEQKLKLKTSDWLMLSAGSLVIIFSFIYDYIRILLSQTYPENSKALLSEMNNYIPENYHWWIFIAGESILIITMLFILRRSKMTSANTNQYEFTNLR